MKPIRNPAWNRDELILALELYFKFRGKSLPGGNHPDVIELSNILNNLPIHTSDLKGENFRNPNSVTMKLSNFLAVDPEYEGKGLTSIGKADREVWYDFHNNIDQLKLVASHIKEISLSSESVKIENMGEEVGEENAAEGKVLARTHFIRERNKGIVKKKKDNFIKKNGKLFCEACGFDFEEVYGERGKSFIECHHIKPISKLNSDDKTSIKDLMLLCSNCHRIVHTKQPWLTPKELKELIKK